MHGHEISRFGKTLVTLVKKKVNLLEKEEKLPIQHRLSQCVDTSDFTEHPVSRNS